MRKISIKLIFISNIDTYIIDVSGEDFKAGNKKLMQYKTF